MIRLLLALLIVALVLTAVSRMYGLQEREVPPQSPEETIIGSQLDPYNKAQQFSEDYEAELQKQREELDKRIDEG